MPKKAKITQNKIEKVLSKMSPKQKIVMIQNAMRFLFVGDVSDAPFLKAFCMGFAFSFSMRVPEKKQKELEFYLYEITCGRFRRYRDLYYHICGTKDYKMTKEERKHFNKWSKENTKKK